MTPFFEFLFFDLLPVRPCQLWFKTSLLRIAKPFPGSPNPAMDELSPSPKPAPSVALWPCPSRTCQTLRCMECCPRRNVTGTPCRPALRLFLDQGDSAGGISVVAVADFGRQSVSKSGRFSQCRTGRLIYCSRFRRLLSCRLLEVFHYRSDWAQ